VDVPPHTPPRFAPHCIRQSWVGLTPSLRLLHALELRTICVHLGWMLLIVTTPTNAPSVIDRMRSDVNASKSCRLVLVAVSVERRSHMPTGVTNIRRRANHGSVCSVLHQ